MSDNAAGAMTDPAECRWQARDADAAADAFTLKLQRLARSLGTAGAPAQVVEAARLAALDAEGLTRRVRFVRRRTEDFTTGA